MADRIGAVAGMPVPASALPRLRFATSPAPAALLAQGHRTVAEIDAERDQRILKSYAAGESLAEIVEAFGVGSTRILALVREAGLAQRNEHTLRHDEWTQMARDGCRRLLQRQLRTGAYWNMSADEAARRLAELDAE